MDDLGVILLIVIFVAWLLLAVGIVVEKWEILSILCPLCNFGHHQILG